MPQIIWDPDPDGNVQHIGEHGLNEPDVEFVLKNRIADGVCRTTGNPCVFGYTFDGRYIIVVYEFVDRNTIYPLTAYDVPEPQV